MQFSSALGLAAWFASVAAPFTLMADSVTLRPVADTYLSQQSSDGNNGSGPQMVCGTQGPTAGLTKNRGLMKFDLTEIPVQSEIISVVLKLTVVKVPLDATASTFELRRVLQPWNEAEATWNNRISTNIAWSVPGASAPTDFSPVISAMQFIDATGDYTFGSESNLIADAQFWVDNPGANSGWIILSQMEDIAKTARRFASREAAVGVPTLTAAFIPPPKISDPSRADVNFTFHFTVEAGYNYAVEYADAIPSANWLVLTNFGAKAAGFEAGVTNAAQGPPVRFYRLRRAPCNCR